MEPNEKELKKQIEVLICIKDELKNQTRLIKQIRSMSISLWIIIILPSIFSMVIATFIAWKVYGLVNTNWNPANWNFF